MAHKEKFSRGQIGQMCGHYDRSKKDGENIDPKLTQYNYNLAAGDQPLPQLEKIHQRLGEVPHKERKDLKVMVSWIVTAPKDLPEREHRQFFEATYAFCRDRYGAANVISAYVHVDEPNAQPHMHFAFVPVTKDNRISAKDVITRQDLREFHGDLQKHLEHELGHEVGVLNEATREGNKSITELKRISASKELQEAQKTLQEAERVRSDLEAVKGEYEAKKAFISEADKASEISMMYPDYAKVSEKGIIKKQRFVTVPADKWEAKHVSANEKSSIKKAEEALEARIQSFRELASTKHLVELQTELERLQRENFELSREPDRAQEILDRVNRVINEIAPEHAQAFVDQWEADLKGHHPLPDLDDLR